MVSENKGICRFWGLSWVLITEVLRKYENNSIFETLPSPLLAMKLLRAAFLGLMGTLGATSIDFNNSSGSSSSVGSEDIIGGESEGDLVGCCLAVCRWFHESGMPALCLSQI